ncbi:glycosyltransferase [Microbacterium sp. LWS13-1.2]|uniref:Glycosyltransferase family 2 protein n=1 Tax=Microbacterium sp. LWS13-1.2 TaxID=3135264 RepID=A0AAU6SFH3_9MICO
MSLKPNDQPAVNRASVSCVIPTHNRPTELHRALDSALLQSVPLREIVVVDDAASVEVAKLVDLQQAKTHVRIILITLSESDKRGASRSRNAGVEHVTGEFVAFLDDDDYWDPDFIARTLPDPTQHDIGFSWMDVRTEAGVVLSERRGFAPTVAQQVVTRNPGFTGSNFIIRRDCFHGLDGFDEDLRAYNDIDFLVRAVSRGHRIHVAEAVLVHQMIGEGEHLSSRSKRRAKAIRAYARKHDSLLNGADRRRLRRDYHLSLRGSDASRVERAMHFVLMWMNSTPVDLSRTWNQRAAGAKRAYG